MSGTARPATVGAGGSHGTSASARSGRLQDVHVVLRAAEADLKHAVAARSGCAVLIASTSTVGSIRGERCLNPPNPASTLANRRSANLPATHLLLSSRPVRPREQQRSRQRGPRLSRSANHELTASRIVLSRR